MAEVEAALTCVWMVLSVVAEVLLVLKKELVAIMRLHSHTLERWTGFRRSVPDRSPVLGFQ